MQADLEVVSPLRGAVALRDLRLEQGHVGHEGGQAGDGLASAASHAHQQGIASWLLQHTADTGQVLQDVATQCRHFFSLQAKTELRKHSFINLLHVESTHLMLILKT